MTPATHTAGRVVVRGQRLAMGGAVVARTYAGRGITEGGHEHGSDRTISAAQADRNAARLCASWNCLSGLPLDLIERLDTWMQRHNADEVAAMLDEGGV